MRIYAVPHPKPRVKFASPLFDNVREDAPSTAQGRLVDLGLLALARGEWPLVRALTSLIQEKGWRHV